MTASIKAKQLGNKSLTQVARHVNRPVRTLQHWFHESPELFEAVCRSCYYKSIELELE